MAPRSRGPAFACGVGLGALLVALASCEPAPVTTSRAAPSGAVPSATPSADRIPHDVAATAEALAPGTYLVAIDTPTRTYLDFVQVAAGRRWSPEADGWPALARWEKETTVRALRFVAFTPGDVLGRAAIEALLPRTAPSSRSIEITAEPFHAPRSPADATANIQAALDAAKAMADDKHPVDVVVPDGTFDHAAVLEVGANVHLRGAGGVLRATAPAASAVHLAGDRSAALFLKVVSPSSSSRLRAPEASGIWVGARTDRLGQTIHDTLVVGNEVVQPAAAHVFGLGEVGGLWAFNYAHDGFADTFHHTGGSTLCQVVANRASGSSTRGDDLYAFVGYGGSGTNDPVHHCACIANWGRDGHARGLTASGAGFIDFEANDIARTQAAGIYVAQDGSYHTFGSFDVTVVGNKVAMSNLDGTHDGLLAYSSSPDAGTPSRSFGVVPNAIRNLVVKGNRFTDIAASRGHGFGIEVRESCEGGEVSGNTVEHATAPGIVVEGKGFVTSANTFVPR